MLTAAAATAERAKNQLQQQQQPKRAIAVMAAAASSFDQPHCMNKLFREIIYYISIFRASNWLYLIPTSTIIEQWPPRQYRCYGEISRHNRVTIHRNLGQRGRETVDEAQMLVGASSPPNWRCGRSQPRNKPCSRR